MRCGAGRREDGVSVFREVVSLRHFVLCFFSEYKYVGHRFFPL